jgi:hypothetical protein
MNPKTTWWLWGLAVLLVAYIAAFERHNPTANDPAGLAATLLSDFDSTSVSIVEIRRGNPTNSPIRASRFNDQWRLMTPVYPAESSSIESFLRALLSTRRHTYITAQELASQEGWRAIYGFEPPQVSILLEQGTNRHRLLVGAKTMVGNQVYVQRVGDAGLFVADAPFLEMLPSSPDDWRNPMLLPRERFSFDRISLTNGPSVVALEVEPTNQLWRLTKPLTNRADVNAVYHLLDQLRNTRVSRFVTDDPKAELEQFGLQSPRLQIALARGSNTLFHVQFGNAATNDDNQVYARILSASNVVLVPNTLADLLRRPDTAFRDHTLLSLMPSAVSRVEVKTKRDKFAVQKESADSWRIVEPFSAPADFALVQNMINSLAKLQIIDFHTEVVADFSIYGLAPSTWQYALKSSVTNILGATNSLLAQIEFGNGVTNVLDKVFARRSDETSVYTVGLGEALRLPQAAFQLRDRTLWKFDAHQVTNITVTQHGKTRKLARAPGGAWSPDPVINAALEKVLFELGQLRALSWTAQGQEQFSLLGFRQNPYQVAIEIQSVGKPQVFTLDFGMPSASRQRYAATTLEDGKLTIFEFPGALFSDVAFYLSIPPEPSAP